MRGGVVSDMSSTCVQGGLPRPLGGYQPNLIMEPHSPSPAWQLHHPPIIPKQEPMEEDRNDSGINSGSDFHSSSPGSENSQETSAYYTNSGNSMTGRVSTFPSLGYHSHSHPGSSMLAHQHLNVPEGPKSSELCENSDDPLRKLQYTFEKNGLVSPASPKTSEHSADDDNKSDLESEETDEHGLRIPKINSHGKVKTFRCKQCEFVAITKLDFWEHSKNHIKADKLLTCPKCPFVTEYKHHLEYHLRNHFGSKPFKCDKCSYSCVNKSMLNSHMKSHSNVYQYRCSDCSYATKYCHSLKLHLRKYGHKPAMVLNPDGTPNPLPIIDVYGTRRGPKQRPSLQKSPEELVNSPNPLQNQFTHFMLNTTPHMQLPFPYHLLAGFPNPMLFPPNMNRSISEDSPNEEEEEVEKPDSPISRSSTPETVSQPPEVLDLSKPEGSSEQPSKNRRKGKAFKLERLRATKSSDEDENNDDEEEEEESQSNEVVTNNNNNANFSCQYCNISFGDIVLYTMHMGYHGFKDPFTCNMCGEECKDKVSFFLHIARNPHT